VRINIEVESNLPNHAVIVVSMDPDGLTLIVHPTPDHAALSYVLDYRIPASEQEAVRRELVELGLLSYPIDGNKAISYPVVDDGSAEAVGAG
jgi:hypothetical protein